jgi:hypothetical protein
VEEASAELGLYKKKCDQVHISFISNLPKKFGHIFPLDLHMYKSNPKITDKNISE